MTGHHKLFVVGELGRHSFVSQGHEIEQNFQYTVQKPNLSRARIISETLMEQFNNGELDEVYVVYTRMENSMVSEVETVKLLPLERSAFGEDSIPANLRREAISVCRERHGQYRTELCNRNDLRLFGRGVCK